MNTGSLTYLWRSVHCPVTWKTFNPGPKRWHMASLHLYLLPCLLVWSNLWGERRGNLWLGAKAVRWDLDHYGYGAAWSESSLDWEYNTDEWEPQGNWHSSIHLYHLGPLFLPWRTFQLVEASRSMPQTQILFQKHWRIIWDSFSFHTSVSFLTCSSSLTHPCPAMTLQPPFSGSFSLEASSIFSLQSTPASAHLLPTHRATLHKTDSTAHLADDGVFLLQRLEMAS